MSVDDKYTYPGSGGVIVNSFGIKDSAELDAVMNSYCSVALADLRRGFPSGPLDFECLRNIHCSMFSRITPNIAGLLRDVNVQATGRGIAYCRPDYIKDSLDALFSKLDRENYLRGLDAETFAEKLADRWGELSAIHPFRDGNTRSQSAYITILAERAGHPINWERIEVDKLRDLRLKAVAGEEKPLADYLALCLMQPTDRLVLPSLLASFPLKDRHVAPPRLRRGRAPIKQEPGDKNPDFGRSSEGRT